MKKEKQIPFTQVPLSVLGDLRLRDRDKVVYAIILGKFKLLGYCYLTNKQMGELIGTSEREVRRSLENLENLNYIKKHIEPSGTGFTRKIYPQIKVEGQDVHVQTPRTSPSTYNKLSKESYSNRKKPYDFFSCEGKPTRSTGTEILKSDAIFKATNGTYDNDTFILECKYRAGDTNWRDTSLYKEVSKLLIKKTA